jgi:ribosomal protein S5
MAKATMNALREMRGVDYVAKQRGITPSQVIKG